MMQETIQYGRIGRYPEASDPDDVVDVGVFEQVIDVIERLGHEHAAEMEAWEVDKQEKDCGYSCVIWNRWHSGFYVGVSHQGWRLVRIQPGPSKSIKGSLPGNDLVAFMFPEWTEFRQNQLVSSNEAMELLHGWLETGKVDDQLWC